SALDIPASRPRSLSSDPRSMPASAMCQARTCRGSVSARTPSMSRMRPMRGRETVRGMAALEQNRRRRTSTAHGLTRRARIFIVGALFVMTENTETLQKPLIVQGDRTILAEVASPRYAEARDALARFAELVKSPEHVHTYRLTPLSIWNACAAGEEAAEIVESLRALSRYPVPAHIATEIVEYAGRFGSLTLERAGASAMTLRCRDKVLADL